MRGFQLWVNLPAREKMTAPKYQEYGPERFPEVDAAPGVRAKVIAGEVAGVRGPIEQPATEPTYLDLRLGAGDAYVHPLPEGHAAFVYVYEGAARLGEGEAAATVPAGELAVLGEGGAVRVESREADTRLILVAGKPLREPVARYGPFVMNTQAELQQAFVDYQSGRF